MQRAMELMWPGVPVTAWAIIQPRGSKAQAEMSPASATEGLNAVRISEAACSLTTPIRRLQKISSVSASIAKADHQVEHPVHLERPAGADQGGGLLLLDDQ